MWDQDTMSTDDFLGSVEVPVEQMLGWGTDRHVLDLADIDGKVGTSVSLSVVCLSFSISLSLSVYLFIVLTVIGDFKQSRGWIRRRCLRRIQFFTLEPSEATRFNK